MCTAPTRVINGLSGAIGGGLCHGLAAKLARPEATVIAMMGDGTAGFHFTELDTAVREGTAFVSVVGNDFCWNAEHQIQLREYGPDRITLDNHLHHPTTRGIAAHGGRIGPESFALVGNDAISLPCHGTSPSPQVADMLIANPMYDVVFKHLLEDTTAAKLIIGSILGEEIECLDVVPQESTVRVGPLASTDAPEPPDFTIQRIDFAATVRTAAGERLRVLIEVQKSHYSEDVLRFRRYPGQHYFNENNIVTVVDDGREHKMALKLTTIYFLGQRLPHTDATVLKVTRQYLDAITGAQLVEREAFVESLTHDCYVVQVPLLSARRRNDLERLLSVFDQELRTDNGHVLEMDESQVPPRYAPVLRRLERAVASRELEVSMALEDEMVGEWSRMYRIITEQKEALAEHKETLARQRAEIEELRRRLGNE